MVYNVFVGAETGLLKGVNIHTKQWTNLNSVECVSRQNEIASMCWGNKEQNKICLALKSNIVLEYNTMTKDVTVHEMMKDTDGCFKGLCRYNDTFVTCTDNGILKTWGSDATSINVGENIKKMRQNPFQQNVFATGGKENDLKLWDLNKPEEAIFKAKNVRNDSLDLRVPVCVMDMGFFDDNTVAVSTGYNKIRVYDPRMAVRRPVLDISYGEFPITALSVRPNTKQVVVGNTRGYMASFDLRASGSQLRGFKGIDGGIRSLQCHATQNLVASCGLDRYLRLHDLDKTKPQHKFYLKSRLNCLLFADDWQDPNKKDDEEDVWDDIEEVSDEENSGKKDTKRKRDNTAEEDDQEPPAKLKESNSKRNLVESKASKKRKSPEKDTEEGNANKKAKTADSKTENRKKRKSRDSEEEDESVKEEEEVPKKQTRSKKSKKNGSNA